MWCAGLETGLESCLMTKMGFMRKASSTCAERPAMKHTLKG
jgi:hypothetical protein